MGPGLRRDDTITRLSLICNKDVTFLEHPEDVFAFDAMVKFNHGISSYEVRYFAASGFLKGFAMPTRITSPRFTIGIPSDGIEAQTRCLKLSDDGKKLLMDGTPAVDLFLTKIKAGPKTFLLATQEGGWKITVQSIVSVIEIDARGSVRSLYHDESTVESIALTGMKARLREGEWFVIECLDRHDGLPQPVAPQV